MPNRSGLSEQGNKMPRPTMQQVNTRLPTSLIEELEAFVDEHNFHFVHPSAPGGTKKTRSDIVRMVLAIALEERAYRHSETKWRITLRVPLPRRHDGGKRLHEKEESGLSELFESREEAENRLKAFVTGEGYDDGYYRDQFRISALQPAVAGRTGHADALVEIAGYPGVWLDIESFFTSLGLSPVERHLWYSRRPFSDYRSGQPGGYSLAQHSWELSQLPSVTKGTTDVGDAE